MTTYQGNSDGAMVERLSDIMAAYDLLPPLVRLAVSFSPLPISPIEVAKYRHDFPAPQLAEAVIRQSWSHVAQTFQSKWGRAPEPRDLQP